MDRTRSVGPIGNRDGGWDGKCANDTFFELWSLLEGTELRETSNFIFVAAEAAALIRRF